MITSYPMDWYKDSSGEHRLPIRISIEDEGTYVKITGPYASTFVVEPEKNVMFSWACFLVEKIMRFTRFDIGPENKIVFIKPFVEIPLQDAPLTEHLLHAYLADLNFQVDFIFWHIYRALNDGDYMINNYAQHNHIDNFGRIWNLTELLALTPVEVLEEAMRRKRAIASN